MERLTIIEGGQVRIVGMNARNETTKVINVAQRLAEYEDCGREPKEVKAALEKQIQKEPKEIKLYSATQVGIATFGPGTIAYKCQCDSFVGYRDRFCRDCGQAQEWPK